MISLTGQVRSKKCVRVIAGFRFTGAQFQLTSRSPSAENCLVQTRFRFKSVLFIETSLYIQKSPSSESYLSTPDTSVRSPVFLFWPKYRSGHPKIFLILHVKYICVGSKYPKNVSFTLPKNVNVCVHTRTC